MNAEEMKPYYNLANAVVWRAVMDWRIAFRNILKYKVVLGTAEGNELEKQVKDWFYDDMSVYPTLVKFKNHLFRIDPSNKKIKEKFISYVLLKCSCEEFFRSGWFEELTDIDSKWMLAELHRDFYENRRYSRGKDENRLD